mmetsp:Transcript_23439/g.38791  ORF Transcript_23439/g.38791 Transcript_23439/m.38791 type:complete len:677 (+) Transcript_23439:87-2117(+)|eukprot:CAMPEP_0119016140 /NCGR_PEP_ID=MMETSP1176-20130426/11834_1 /TAXON_ID=265551 /ORGANISM="Synedropsis recta cf, Strain CCMP1620" /LENGTH=676 /DNA_ID=CAMNT_0006969473 /DNA_START=35 /DNA_END=2065 /DNA_ORIENTATION=-
MIFKAVKLAQIISGVYILIVTFTYAGRLGSFGGARDPDSGFIIDPYSNSNTEAGIVTWNGDYRAIVANSPTQMVLLGISRFSGYFMYPCLILVFLTKLRATGAFLSGSLINMFMYQDLHRLHVYCGWVILLDSCVHTTCHLTRWALQGNLVLLFQHASGVTGLMIILSTFLICVPMMVWKEKIRYELRKLLHYLFLVFALALCFHAPQSAVPNGGFCAYIFPTILVWYGLDCLFCALFMTESIETTRYHTLTSGVQMTMKVSKRFQQWGNGGGYAYVCFPWVDRHQWHAFSLFENPEAPEERQIFMQRTGDWTTKVHALLQRDSVRPVWIMGPFPSPYKNAVKYDNQVLVAAGIGITPALSVIRAHKDHRCINLIWAVRDPAMLQFFLEHALLDNRGWNLIFYTGKQPLVSYLIDSVESTNVCIIHARPNLDDLIPNIVYGFESGKGRPERYLPNKKNEAIEQLHERLKVLDRSPAMTQRDKICDLADYAEGLGYIFSDLAAGLDSIVDNNDLPVKGVSSSTLPDAPLPTTFPTESDDELRELNPSPKRGLMKSAGRKASRRVISVDAKVLTKLRSFVVRPGTKKGDTFDEEYQSSMVDDRAQSEQWDKLMGGMTENFKPWERHTEAAPFVSNLDKTIVKSTWGILYCGGQGRLLTNLKKVAKNVEIKLHEESFAW